MSMPRGSSPENADKYYQYLLAHHQNDGRVGTWSVDWISLAWMWGFVVAISVSLIWWIWSYRTTLRRVGLYPIDQWGEQGSYVTEIARPASRFFVVFTIGVTVFAIFLIAGHLIWGQVF
ncbi:MAG TPA: hypothetical protein VK488_10985 [Gaiellaceae bacterium]|nr:hypothetical protein [Gaiellaceae bacterium]